ncbi:MAG TPA: urease accessory protein UreD [Humisphaera sp.]
MTICLDDPTADAAPTGSSRPTSAARRPPPGTGLVELAVVAGRTEVVRLRHESPLRLLVPRQRSAAPTSAWVVAGSYGGGLVAGDTLAVTLRAGPGTSALLGTQASTKVFRSAPGRRGVPGATAAQRLAATLADGATLVAWPDPVTCFAGSRFEQVQRFDLDPSASLLAVDWLTSGRMARGERWAFARYRSETTISVGGATRVKDATLLDPADGPLDAVARTGGFDCLGMAWAVGPCFAGAAAGLQARLGRASIDPRRDVQFAVSPIDGGTVVRFAGRSTEAAWRWLREHLTDGLAAVGLDPWARRG